MFQIFPEDQVQVIIGTIEREQEEAKKSAQEANALNQPKEMFCFSCLKK